MSKKRSIGVLHEAILSAAQDGRGLRLSPPEVDLLAKQPFLNISPRVLDLEWRRIPGFDRYEVSEEGHVRRGMKLLKQTESKSRHMNVTVYSHGGEQWRVGVHHLVALAFCGPRSILKPFACHRNGRPWENNKDNLYWGDHADNMEDMKRHASLYRRPPTKKGESVELSKALDTLLGETNG